MINFTKNNENKLSSLGVGQVHLIKSWLDEMEVKNYVINDDLTINVIGDVNLSSENLAKFPYYIQFNEVNGYFSCSRNKLISLKGCPKIINNNFYCYDNKLYSLEGCPKIVYGRFICRGNIKEFTEDEIRKYCNVKTNEDYYKK